MNLFLGDFFNTLTKRTDERVSALVQETTVGKQDLSTLSDRLASQQPFSALIFARQLPLDVIEAAPFSMNFRDLSLQTDELYRVFENISLLLDSHAKILGSQIKAVEDQLLTLEKMANNTAFLLADGGSFNFAYLETFSDELGRDSTITTVPDRASLQFGPAEQAQVRTDEGVLALSPSILNSIGLSGQILGGNATAFVRTNTELNNAFIQGSTTGWRYTVATPSPVTYSMTDARGHEGAQVLLEFYLSSPSPASQIKINPFADHPIEITSIKLYANVQDAEAVEMLTDVQTIDRPYTLSFPTRNIAKFRMLINQPVYDRGSAVANTAEDTYRDVYDAVTGRSRVDQRYANLTDFYNSFQTDTGIMRAYVQTRDFPKDRQKILVGALPRKAFDKDFGPMRIDTILINDQLKGEISQDQWSSDSSVGDAVRRSLYTLTGNILPADMFHRIRTFPYPTAQPGHFTTNDPLPPPAESSTNGRREGPIVLPPNAKVPRVFDYEYSLGIEYIGIGAISPGFKGVWVSKPLESLGDIGQLRLKTSEDNPRVTDVTLDNDILTSVEYSVTNVAQPNTESNWQPLLPIGTTFVESERFFPDVRGYGLFRFTADRNQNIGVFRNGVRINVDPTATFVYNSTHDAIIGLNLPLGETAPDDIFTVSYIPAVDDTTVDLLGDPPLISAYDATGVGEGFLSTGSRNTIDLAHVPYVDQAKVDATYNSPVKVPLYQPITVQLDNGTIAANGTNYGVGDQTPLAQDPTTIAYIHSGATLIFNNPIPTPFRVYYQYLTNSVRVRVVLRVNSKNFASPSVDYYHAKAQTRRPQLAKVLQ